MKISIILFSSLMGLVLTTEVSASENKVLTTALSYCTKISNGIERLACFDKLANKSVDHSTPVIDSVEISVKENNLQKQKEAKRIDAFSKESLKKSDEEKGPDRITAKINKLNKLIRGEWVIYFENGQKWQQTDTTRFKLSVGINVRLEKGSLGVVYLYKEGSSRSIRVKRLK